MTDMFAELGIVAVGSRVRLLGDRLTRDAELIYRLYGITMAPKWFPVFYVLSRGEAQTITAIARAIGHSHVSVSKIAAEMKVAKLVTETRGATDKRSTLLTLSSKGRAFAAKIEDQYADVGAALREMSATAKHDLWVAIDEWEYLLKQKSLYERVAEMRKRRTAERVRIVPFASKYKTAFRLLNEEWIKTFFKMEKPDRDALSKPESYILKRGGHIFVALLDNEPVGVCALIKRDDAMYPYELAKMAVAPRAQGQGIGARLGKAVIAQARALKARRLFLESNTILAPAIALYEKLGFRKVVGPQTPYERCNIQMVLELHES